MVRLVARKAYVGAHFTRLNEHQVLMITSTEAKVVPFGEFEKGFESMLLVAQERKNLFIEPDEILVGA